MSERAILLDEAAIARRVQEMAAEIAPRLKDGAVLVCLLTGGIWFAADLTRALSRLGRDVAFDALWIASYGDGRESAGRCEVRADLQRPVGGRQVLIVDDVLDSGLSLAFAHAHLRNAGASEALTAVFAAKPWPRPRPLEPDFVGWRAPGRFLVGYGMDDAGQGRGQPFIGAVD